jgi:PDZ domain-containing protein
VNGLVTVSDHPVYPPKGKVMLTTVSVRERVNLVEALAGWADPDVDVVSEREIRGSIPPEQYKRLNVEAMGDSKTTAEVIVLRKLGYTDLGEGAEVVTVEPGSPAAQGLKPADVLVAVDGAPVTTSAEAVAAIQARKPGDVVALRVLREGQPLDLTAELATGDAGQPLLGVRMTTKVKLPFPISIDSGTIEGPSAGLAYALELLDYLTPGELTGGSSVAATGELGADGKVRPIGGIAQKAATVRDAGIKLFLVPQENYAEAKAHAGDLEVRAVDSFEQALQSLGSLPDSNALALAQPGGGPA